MDFVKENQHPGTLNVQGGRFVTSGRVSHGGQTFLTLRGEVHSLDVQIENESDIEDASGSKRSQHENYVGLYRVQICSALKNGLSIRLQQAGTQ